MTVTPVYAGILGLLFVILSFRVIGRRRSAKVGLGDGGDIVLTRRLRVHGNFCEYAPMGLVLLALAELQSSPALVLHLIGSLLVAGRVIHAIGLGREPDLFAARVGGMVLTLSALIIGALANLGSSAIFTRFIN